jgi:hypothetical protein
MEKYQYIMLSKNSFIFYYNNSQNIYIYFKNRLLSKQKKKEIVIGFSLAKT